MIEHVARISPVVVSLVGWTTGAATAIGVGLIALSAIGVGLAEGPIRPLSTNPQSGPARVPVETLSPTPPGQRTSTGPATAPAGASSERTVTSRGGNVVAACRASGAYLVGWSPAPGYRAEDVARGPAQQARLTFKKPEREIKVTVRCVNGVVQASIEDEPEDDHTS
jgi:hypothetical protein